MSYRGLLHYSTSARVGSALLALLLLGAILGPLVLRIDPSEIDVMNRFAPPGLQHLLGTDNLGRDILARLLHGARASLSIALVAVALPTVVGFAIGVAAGYIAGALDLVTSRIVDLFFAIPPLLIAIAVVALFGPSAMTTVLAIGISYCPIYARVVRAAVVGIRDRPYVDVSRVLGASGWRILRFDIVPGIFAIMVVQSTTMIAWALIDEASLGFLGLGVQAPAASWGSMLGGSQAILFMDPKLAIIPGVAVVIAVLSFNLIGDALARASDPRLAQRGLVRR